MKPGRKNHGEDTEPPPQIPRASRGGGPSPSGDEDVDSRRRLRHNRCSDLRSRIVIGAGLAPGSGAAGQFPRYREPPPRAGRPAHVRCQWGVGDGGGGGGGKGGKGDGWLDRGEESDQLREVRELISEQSLPVSFGIEGERNGESPSADDPSEEERPDGDEEESAEAPANGTGAVSAGLARPDGGSSQGSGLDLKDNPYLDVVSRLSPSDLISKFTSSAHPRVQDAVRSTILGLIGNLPKMAFDTTTVTTGERLASLMFQLQMTGYMFKNAEYRLR